MGLEMVYHCEQGSFLPGDRGPYHCVTRVLVRPMTTLPSYHFLFPLLFPRISISHPDFSPLPLRDERILAPAQCIYDDVYLEARRPTYIHSLVLSVLVRAINSQITELHVRAIFFFWVLCSFVRHVCSSSYLNIVRFLRFTRNLSVQILFSRCCRDVYQDDKYIHVYICNIFIQVTRVMREEIGLFF
jgi:hypothetical protein